MITRATKAGIWFGMFWCSLVSIILAYNNIKYTLHSSILFFIYSFLTLFHSDLFLLLIPNEMKNLFIFFIDYLIRIRVGERERERNLLEFHGDYFTLADTIKMHFCEPTANSRKKRLLLKIEFITTNKKKYVTDPL